MHIEASTDNSSWVRVSSKQGTGHYHDIRMQLVTEFLFLAAPDRTILVEFERTQYTVSEEDEFVTIGVRVTSELSSIQPPFFIAIVFEDVTATGIIIAIY